MGVLEGSGASGLSAIASEFSLLLRHARLDRWLVIAVLDLVEGRSAGKRRTGGIEGVGRPGLSSRGERGTPHEAPRRLHCS